MVELGSKLYCFVIYQTPDGSGTLNVVTACRRAALRTDFYHGASSNLGKQLKASETAGTRFAVILDSDGEHVHIKDMHTREDRAISLDAFVSDPKQFIRRSP